MKVYTAPEIYQHEYLQFRVFLAGGITNCPDWQKMVIDELSKYDDTDLLVIFNPRRDSFDATDKSASRKQIEWEFEHQGRSDFNTMFFCDGPSDQPICMYELGKFIEEMDLYSMYINSNDLLITCMSGYKRLEDVLIQTEIATYDAIKPTVFDTYEEAVKHHAAEIIKKYRKYIKNVVARDGLL